MVAGLRKVALSVELVPVAAAEVEIGGDHWLFNR